MNNTTVSNLLVLTSSHSFRVLNAPLAHVNYFGQTSLTLSPQPTSSKSPPAKSHQKQPTINHEATPLSANSKNITTNLTVTIPSKATERIKQARPAPTTSISPTTHEPPNKKLRQQVFFNSQGWINQADYDHIMSDPRQL
ncbi:hypothetical protein BDC45DRAFT_571089 [Circinella umbellata]|nr:hypothetical protein BDC45DRAFT_571089 [Circinella umbellata]